MEDINWGNIFVWVVLIWFGLNLIRKYLEAKNEMLEAELKQMQKTLKEKFIHVNIEKHGEVFYLFEKETDRFIAQGSDMNELKLHCDSRFKNSTVVADNKDLELAGLK
jgi:hypothetical protein